MRTTRSLAVAVLALPLTVSGAPAQGIHIGPGGVGVDMGGDHHRRVIREYEDDDGCTIRVIRYRRGDGDVVTRRERRC
ncbi:hypothetical protein M2323_001126 [Rhodoblastus acidophilus]|uniref:hypothetical protein n=1 Tax=Rhodoblastus acidophilus TaxID=1074 RepID=UPI0022246E41|nr:hypothetical protein [Rhodoblastus acidophilus]MCW2283460.1 hypothetical protein [Rhodoblastus acidophilus]MCW2332216.1 hypothetical protein [Rhodoblastus acidophilus]